MKLHSKQPAIVTSIGYLAGKMCDIKLKSAGTNTRFAPCRDAPRRPCCSLCSARARSGLCTTDPRGTSVGIWLGRSATSSGIAPSPVADSQPKRQAPTRDWSPGRRIESAHPLQRMDLNCVGAVASSAREVRRAIICRSREAQVCALAEPERASRLNYTARSRRQCSAPCCPSPPH